MRCSRWVFVGLLGMVCGCRSLPNPENPALVQPATARGENPILVAPGEASGDAYGQVFDRTYDVLMQYFPIEYSNRYDGRIVGSPTIAPGLDRWWKRGSPSFHERTLATLQTMRYRCSAQIRPAEQGGYFVKVTVLRELRDDPLPQGAPGVAVFRDTATVDRVFNIVDDVQPTDDSRWIPKGRETALEHALLRKIQDCWIPGR